MMTVTVMVMVMVMVMAMAMAMAMVMVMATVMAMAMAMAMAMVTAPTRPIRPTFYLPTATATGSTESRASSSSWTAPPTHHKQMEAVTLLM